MQLEPRVIGSCCAPLRRDGGQNGQGSLEARSVDVGELPASVLAKYDRAMSEADSPRGPGIDDTDADPPVAKGLTLHRLTDMSKVPEGVTVVRTVPPYYCPSSGVRWTRLR
jgi:hypothetical protein